MHLFSRQIQFVGAPGEIRAFATDMRAFASERFGREVGLWSVLFGAPAGSMAYTMAVEGVADYLALQATVLGNEEYEAKVAGAQHLLAGPPVDLLAQPLHGEMSGERPPVGACAVNSSATVAVGKYEEAFAWGIDMAQHVGSITGTPVMFLASSYGTFGEVAWISVHADATAADAARTATYADANYMKKLGDAHGLFVEGSGNQMIATRID